MKNRNRRSRMQEIEAIQTSIKNPPRRILTVPRILIFALSIAIMLLVFGYSQMQSAMMNKYTQSYQNSMQNLEGLLTQCKTSSFDYDGNYRNVIGELGTARAMISLMQEPQTHVVAINDLYTASIKLPNQMKLHLGDIIAAVDQINKNDADKGYTQLETVIQSFNKEDY